MIFQIQLKNPTASSKMEQTADLKAKPIPFPDSKAPKAKRISISILVISLPVLYVSLLHVPPSKLIKDTTFWFLISNSIIIIVAADYGVFSSFGYIEDIYDDFMLHNRNRNAPAMAAAEPATSAVVGRKVRSAEEQMQSARLSSHKQRERQESRESQMEKEKMDLPPIEEEEVKVRKKKESLSRSPSGMVVARDQAVQNEKALYRLATEPVAAEAASVTSGLSLPSSSEEESEYWSMSDDELNKRVEEFIRRFNREIMLQEVRK